MTDLGKRILDLRKKKNLSQTDLASDAGISYAQIGRYETKNTQPPAEVLKKIADTLDTTVDYLINGDTGEKAKSALKDIELLQQFKAVEQMNEADRTVIKKLIDAFITKAKIKQLALWIYLFKIKFYIIPELFDFKIFVFNFYAIDYIKRFY